MKTTLRILCLVGFMLIAAGCQFALPGISAPTTAELTPTMLVSSPIPLPGQTPAVQAPTSPSIPAATPVMMGEFPSSTVSAVETVKNYFSALQAGDSQAASRLISTLSLTVDSMTRDDAAAELQAYFGAGWKYTDLKIIDSQQFDDKTVLVHVAYRLTKPGPSGGKISTTTMDELWPVRNEVGAWLYNRNNLVDFHSIDIAEQETAGLTIKPSQLIRYTDQLTMVFLAQNNTNEAIVLGDPGEVMAAFTFGSQKVEAVQDRLVFDRLRSYPRAEIHVKGFFKSYPDEVEIRRWKNSNAAPWFTFTFGS